MKKLFFLLLLGFNLQAQSSRENAVAETLDQWHAAAASADLDHYFGAMAKDAVFVGTDPTEHWSRDAFFAFCKPYFENGKAWDFKAVERHIYFSEDGKLAWFDELLNTWMKVCRGSGVLKKENGQWKIVHYVLSMTVPNNQTEEVIKLKADFDEKLLDKLKK